MSAAAKLPPDPGLFGPDSITWRVHADPILWVGGLRALLLQALHPVAMAGVAQHSGFRADPWGRLFRTAEYVATVSFGTTEEARQASARVRAIHARVRGVEPESGQPYRADDPALLAWVHCAQVDSFLAVARRAGISLTPAEADRYVDEQRRLGPLVGLDSATLPRNTRELASYFERMRPLLRLTAESRSAVAFVFFRPRPRRVQPLTPARPGWLGVSGLALALLPRWARRLYRLPGLPVTDLAATATVRALRAGLWRLPANLREGPHLRDARARLLTA